MNPLATILRAALAPIGLWPASNRVRRFDAASGTARGNLMQRTPSVALAAQRDAGTIRQRARHISINNAIAVRAIDAIGAALWGTGIKPQSRHPSPPLRERLNTRFEAWTPHADTERRLDFYALGAALVRSMVVDGEGFVHMQPGPDGRLRLHLLPADMLPAETTSQLPNGNRVVAGIELAPDGTRLAYHFLRNRPGDPLGYTLDTVRLPAVDVLHLFRPLEPGQQRGVSWFAPVLQNLTDIDGFYDARLLQARIAAMFAGFVRDADGTAAGLAPDQAGPTADLSMEPGIMRVLPPGTDIEFANPPQFQDTGDFVKGHMRGIAGALGLTYESLTGDYSAVNYSSARAAMLDMRRVWELLQWSLLVPLFVRPVWERWIRLEALAGNPALAGFASSPDPFLEAAFVPPAWGWVDPLKEIEAAERAIAAGLRSRRQVVAEAGEDIERLDAEIAADRTRAVALGLDFGRTTTASLPERRVEPDESRTN